MSDESGLAELLEALRWRWKPILLVAVPFFLAATIPVELLPSQYDAEAVIAFAPRPDVSVGAETVRIVVPKYVSYATAPSTAEAVAAEVGLDVGEVESAVDAGVAPDTGTLTITARRESPEEAAELANAVADRVEAFADDDPVLAAQEVAEARPPSEAAAPPRRIFEAAALLGGVLLGIAVALLLERGRPRIRTWRDIVRRTGYPVLGRVPTSAALRSNRREAYDDERAGPAFRVLRANLERRLREAGAEVVVVISPRDGDGRTTVAALLAESMSRIGRNTLLVDADLRQPEVTALAELNGNAGLADVLHERAKLEAAVKPGWKDSLSILPTAPEDDAADLLARGFAAVADAARRRFDVVLVDTPALLAGDDALAAVAAADGALLVVSAGSPASEVDDAVAAVESLQVPLLGVVGNRFSAT